MFSTRHCQCRNSDWLRSTGVQKKKPKNTAKMHMPQLHLAIPILLFISLFLSPHCCFASTATEIYIDKAQGYENLASCAEVPLSRIVRDMAQGCYDGSRLTSYSCFCTDSYRRIGFDISTAVSTTCGTTSREQVTSALDVFQRYCLEGSQQLITKETQGMKKNAILIKFNMV